MVTGSSYFHFHFSVTPLPLSLLLSLSLSLALLLSLSLPWWLSLLFGRFSFFPFATLLTFLFLFFFAFSFAADFGYSAHLSKEADKRTSQVGTVSYCIIVLLFITLFFLLCTVMPVMSTCWSDTVADALLCGGGVICEDIYWYFLFFLVLACRHTGWRLRWLGRKHLMTPKWTFGLWGLCALKWWKERWVPCLFVFLLFATKQRSHSAQVNPSCLISCRSSHDTHCFPSHLFYSSFFLSLIFSYIFFS